MNKLIDQIMVRNGKTQYYVSITSEYIYRFKPKNNKKPRGGFCLLSWLKKKKRTCAEINLFYCRFTYNMGVLQKVDGYCIF